MGPDGLSPHTPRPSGLASVRTIGTHLRRLPPGDRAIAAVLGVAFLILLFLGLYALERQFLVEVPSRGGTLAEGVVGTPRFANPLLALSDADRDLVALTYAGLMGYRADGTLGGVLAESYEVSEDGTVYTFRLREDAAFSDGSSVTASDVVFTVEKAQDPGLKSPEFANWANIRAEAIDARTVRFTLPEPYAPFLSDATLGILPMARWRDVRNEEFPFSPLSENPIGAGPFVPVRIDHDDKGAVTRYELRANPSFALGRPYLDSIRLEYFTDEESLRDALREGRVESGYGIPPEKESDRAIVAPYSRIFGVFWNASENPLFARDEVREALSVALDRDDLIERVLGGYGMPSYGPVPPGSITDPFRPETPPDRIEAAAALLEASDWTYDRAARLWEGPGDTGALSVTLSTANVPELKVLAEHIRDNWGRLGVPVEIEFHTPSDLASSVIRPREYEALLFGMAVGRSHDLYAFWDSSGRADPGLNVALFASRSVDALLEDIRQEQDPVRRAELLARLDREIAAEYPAAFTHAPEFIYRVPSDLWGLSLAEIAAPSDRFAGVNEWYRRTEHVWPALAP